MPRGKGRREPPPGYLTATQAGELLGPNRLYKLIKDNRLHRKAPPGYKHGYYLMSEVQAIIDAETAFYTASENQETSTKLSEKLKGHTLEFAQATADDTEGIHEVASKLFPHTTSADTRKPLIAACPVGNYVVKDNGQIVAYIHIQPLKHDRLMAFIKGEIRGWQLTADDLDCFGPGKTVEVLIKSIGSYHEDNNIRLAYMQRLLNGTMREIAKLGQQGVVLTKIYATSDTPTGIAMSIHAKMRPLGAMKGSDGKRFAFELDVAESNLPLLRDYKQALAEWKQSHKIDTSTTQ